MGHLPLQQDSYFFPLISWLQEHRKTTLFDLSYWNSVIPLFPQFVNIIDIIVKNNNRPIMCEF
jgi:hypothetical protein